MARMTRREARELTITRKKIRAEKYRSTTLSGVAR